MLPQRLFQSTPTKPPEEPHFYNTRISGAYGQGSFYWNASINEGGFLSLNETNEIEIVIYTYTAFKMLVTHINTSLNIDIRLAETKHKGMHIISEFMHHSDRPAQMGLVFFENDNVKGHPITCVLCDDKVNNKIILLVANSINGIENYYLPNPHLNSKDKGAILFSEIHEMFPALEMRFDLTGRQVDNNSSDTDAILYLTAALQRDMLKESIFLTTTMASGVEYVEGFPKPLLSCTLFISPIQTFYHSQATLIPSLAKISYSGETKRLIENLAQYEEKNGLTKKIVYCDWEGRPKLSEYKINTSLWDKAIEFKQLLATKMQANSPGLFQTFLNQVQVSPHKTAVIYNDVKVSYYDFANSVNQLAVNLKANHAALFTSNHQPILIGVQCQSKLAALYAEFAILQLGAAFVPFNSDDNKNRHTFMQAKSGVSLILTDSDEDNNNNVAHCNITPLLKNVSSTETLSVSESPTDLAYVLFTSGSTAENPKGVMRTRGGLLQQMVSDYKNDLAITSQDCVLNLAVFTHDQAIVDCFAALLNGCTLCLYDVKNFPVTHLHQFMQQHEVTVFSSIPSVFATIFADIKDKNTFPALRVVTLGGEETMLEHALLYQRTTPEKCMFINGYGATEMSWISSYFINHHTDLNKLQTIPLGQLTASAQMKLIPFTDEENTRAHVHELCVSSSSLALGYLQDDEATREAFFVEDDLTYYRTSDIVSLDERNCLHFVGRKAWHENINGKRVNCREIENTLKKVMQVNECVVLAYGENEDKKLYAFYTKRIEKDDLQKITLQLHHYLKDSMMPRLLPIQTLPTLANGKVNRRALREVLKNEVVLSESDKDAIKILQQSNDPSVVIEGFWREVLDLPVTIPLNRNDVFKTLGGTSMAALQLTNKINKYFAETHQVNLRLSLIALYNDQTTYTSFSNDVLTSYTQMKQGLKKYGEPSCHTTSQFDLPFTSHHWSFFWEAKECPTGGITDYKEVKLVIYNYAAFQILIDHFNALNYSIFIAETKHKGIELIRQFINNPSRPSQIGLIFFTDDNTNAHVIPMVLCEDIINKKFVLLVADCLPGIVLLTKFKISAEKGLFAEIQKEFPELEIRFDLTGRQVDSNSCNTDAILYLLAVLRRDMLKESHFLPATMQSVFDPYLSLIENPTLHLKSWQLFISPIEAFYHSQLTATACFRQSELSDEEECLIEKLKQYEEEKKLTKKVLLCCWGKYKDYDMLTEHNINTTVWDKSFEFKAIVESIYAKIQENERKQLQQQTQNTARLFTPVTPPSNTNLASANIANLTKTGP